MAEFLKGVGFEIAPKSGTKIDWNFLHYEFDALQLFRGKPTLVYPKLIFRFSGLIWDKFLIDSKLVYLSNNHSRIFADIYKIVKSMKQSVLKISTKLIGDLNKWITKRMTSIYFYFWRDKINQIKFRTFRSKT
jgi:hypothetical protein